MGAMPFVLGLYRKRHGTRGYLGSPIHTNISTATRRHCNEIIIYIF